MKNMIITLIIAVMVCLISCNKDNHVFPPFIIEGITKDNYPKVDGSTSAQPLQTLMASKLLGIQCDWKYDFMYMHHTLLPSYDDNQDDFSFILQNVRNTGTHTSIMNLINGDADFIIVAREASDEELAVAEVKHVRLIHTPIALDAFTFIVNAENPVNSLTTAQIQGIYTGAITNWNQVGGNDAEIIPYKRNPTSGSQVLMEELVMKGLTIDDLPIMEVSPTMWGPFDLLSYNENGICYTVYYYKEFMARNLNVKHIGVDGVYPDHSTLENREYPYITDVYAVIREDLDPSSMACKLYELLLTRAGTGVIKESGYVPYQP
jgi:phosphate transport system substrate-binding protein